MNPARAIVLAAASAWLIVGVGLARAGHRATAALAVAAGASWAGWALAPHSWSTPLVWWAAAVTVLAVLVSLRVLVR